ncbi:hypothetical protein [Sphingomonas sp.]|uniref:hypothetical protein n=1 Tax=Sphingomonas sp. TaxID=28214 RepID=UPI0038A3C569
MNKRHLAAILFICGVPANAAPSVVVHQPIDTPTERQALRKLTFCVAERRPRWAHQLVSYPYLSDAQASAAAELVSGRDNCLGAPEVAVAFRISGVAGAVAEYFVRSDLGTSDLRRVSAALATAPPLNVSEDFALCVASRNPAAAVDLVRSELGSADEMQTASALANGVPSCTMPGERVQVDLQALRALIATALYRAVTASSWSNG